LCGRKLIVYFLLLLIALYLSAIPVQAGKKQKSEEKRELRFWHSIGTYNKDILTSLIQSYNETNRLTTVKGVFQGNDEEVFRKLFSQETLPDIVQLSVQFLPSLTEKKYLTDLTSLLPNRIKEDISEKFWNTVSFHDRIYGIPFQYSVNLLFVNQHIMRISGVRQEKTPESWNEILMVAERVKGNLSNQWPLYIPMESTAHFISFVQSYTGTPVIQNGKIVVNTDEVINAMKFLRDLVYQRKIMPAKITIDEGENLFLSGNLGVMSASSSMLVYTESHLPYDMNVWHLPSSRNTRPVVTGSCLTILKSNPRWEKEAFKFIEYLADYENAIKWHTHTGNPAIRTSVKESLDLLIFYEDNPNHMASVNELERGVIFNPSSGYLELNTIIKEALESIMIKGEDPGKILQEAQKKLDRLGTVF